ncbi:hypothetical protein AAT19DRAFT_8829 [Rhodotorula toruloides]|uniref:Uncharacterized protein n=1 Tax=Rhodotorula toruloides TaxID=5286 RepID=A0A2T0AIB9_RHOTO|nr:hypothetical protein AAT19DRAFT_8829 [Rhodotorula toruloides]
MTMSVHCRKRELYEARRRCLWDKSSRTGREARPARPAIQARGLLFVISRQDHHCSHRAPQKRGTAHPDPLPSRSIRVLTLNRPCVPATSRRPRSAAQQTRRLSCKRGESRVGGEEGGDVGVAHGGVEECFGGGGGAGLRGRSLKVTARFSAPVRGSRTHRVGDSARDETLNLRSVLAGEGRNGRRHARSIGEALDRRNPISESAARLAKERRRGGSGGRGVDSCEGGGCFGGDGGGIEGLGYKSRGTSRHDA